MKADYERFMQDLEQVAQKLASLNVAGIAEGLTEDVAGIILQVVTLKSRARFIGGRFAHAPGCSGDCDIMPDGTAACHTPIGEVSS